jgi:hypothetical protein
MIVSTFIVQASFTIVNYNSQNMFIIQATGGSTLLKEGMGDVTSHRHISNKAPLPKYLSCDVWKTFSQHHPSVSRTDEGKSAKSFSHINIFIYWMTILQSEQCDPNLNHIDNVSVQLGFFKNVYTIDLSVSINMFLTKSHPLESTPCLQSLIFYNQG